MDLEITYTTVDLFTLGELQAIVAQVSESVPDDAIVVLIGDARPKDNSEDVIKIQWDNA